MILIQSTIVIAYGLLSGLEYLSFYSRLAGKVSGAPVSGYAQQNIILMVSRFASVLLMPALGYLVDKQISTKSYLVMVVCSLVMATIISLVVRLFKKKIVRKMARLIGSNETASLYDPQGKTEDSHAIMILSASLVYFAYGMAFFISYFAALRIPDLRTTLANSAAAINGLATVLLSVYVEPKISRIIDTLGIKETDHVIESLLNGRLIAISFISPVAAIAALWWYS